MRCETLFDLLTFRLLDSCLDQQKVMINVLECSITIFSCPPFCPLFLLKPNNVLVFFIASSSCKLLVEEKVGKDSGRSLSQ